MKHFWIVFLTLCVSLITGCQDDMSNLSYEEYTQGKMVLKLQFGEKAETRTLLKGSHDLHHVKLVYTVLYEGEGEKATYLTHQILRNNDGTVWNPEEEYTATNPDDNTTNNLQSKDFELEYPGKLKGIYTLLCVGLDDQSGHVYGLSPEANTPSFCAVGKTLADAKAILAKGKTTHQAELFAGWETFQYLTPAKTVVEVEMRRRVAGVYAYLKDIPVKIDGKDVNSIRLVLGNLPNSQIALTRKNIPQNTTDAEWTDYGAVPQTEDASKVLQELDMTVIAEPNNQTGLYMISQDYTNTMKIPPFTILMGAYILPQKTNQLFVQACDASKSVIKSFPIMLGTQKDILFRPNHVYHIGTRDADCERPASLAGNRLKLEVTKWTEIKTETEFPYIPLNASLDNKSGKNPLKYIYDCINETDSLIITPSILKYDWKLTVVGVKENEEKTADIGIEECNWIYFIKETKVDTIIQRDTVQELSSKDFMNGKEKEITIRFILNDYLKKGLWTQNNHIHVVKEQIKKDWRKAKIMLHTEDVKNMWDSIPIRQYNAIQVQSRESHGSIGFSRFDFGVVRDADGNVVEQGFQGLWGYTETVFNSIYKDTPGSIETDGQVCYEQANKTGKWFEDIWGTANTPLEDQPAIRFAYHPAIEYFVNGSNKLENQVKTQCWYLPSQRELSDFFNDVVVPANDIAGIATTDEGFYWSSTARPIEWTKYRSYCQGLLPNGNLWVTHDKAYDTRELRSKVGFARRARHYANEHETTK